MAEDILKDLSILLNEEKWTRATLNSYSINNFKELDRVLEKAKELEIENEVKELCDEHLKHTKNSIIALYLSGIIALSQRIVDDSNLIMLINIFSDNHKWNVVEYLCNRILDYGENKFALRTLAESYENKNEEEKKYEVWDRLIKVDYEEADIVKLLAEKKEMEGDIEGSIEYYKKAIHRFLNKKLFSNVKEIWEKLVEYAPDDIDFFFSIEKKIVKTLNRERAASLLKELVPYYKDNEDWDTAIDILKKILTYEPKNATARKEIIECFRKKYANHSQLEEYIKLSNLNQSWRNVHDAIADFEKHISFDAGNYVFHRSWGIGKIINVENDQITIDFAKKKNHKMSLKMAVNALKILRKDHIWVLKSTMNREELKKKVKEDPSWALQIIIKSYDNVADMKKIKSELVPDILSTSEWNKWNSEARKILKTDPIFGNLPDKIDQFVVREKPITFEEKTYNKFKAEKNFFDRVQTIQDFLKHADPDSEYFGEMFSYFVSFLKTYTNVTEFVIASYLLVQRIISQYPFLNPHLEVNFKTLFDKIENIEEIFSRIDDSELKRDFLTSIKRNVKNWPEIFSRLFIIQPSKFIVEELVNTKNWEIVKKLFTNIVDNYKEYREAFVWFTRYIIDEPWFEKLELSYEKILIALIHLLDITFREISNKKDVSFNRKLNKQIQDFLFKEEKLLNYILTADRESIGRLYTLVEDIKELDPSIKINIKHKIIEKYPDFRFYGQQEAEKISMGLLMTRESFERKQEELKHLIEVEIPANSKEIGIAMAKGDLRENAEYKAALERQEMLKTTVSKLQEDLQKAQIFNAEDLDTSRVSFGTKVRLKNLKTNQIEEYTILGPWESEPSKNIISYLSPLGSALWNRQKGEKLEFKINENDFHYLIEDIQASEYVTK